MRRRRRCFAWHNDADVVVAKHLRTTVPFLVSARPLSFHWRRRDLVSSMRSFSSRPATWWLMCSEPLSAGSP